MEVDEIAAIVFVDIAVIVAAARLAGAAAKKFRQPAVVGEIIAGIALGPSLLGAFPGDLTTKLFPLEVRPFLNVVAQLGLIMFMFIVGLELDLGLIRGKERTAAVISLSSIALPFSLGVALATLLHSSHSVVQGQAVDFLPFALFIGAAMSITAFPVLARILVDRGMFRTWIGALTLACAAVDDVMAWSLLAVVLAVVTAAGGWDLPVILAESALFVLVMLTIVRPALDRVVGGRYRATGRVTPDLLALVLIGILLCSYTTAMIGIHQIFGAFIFGTIMPRQGVSGLLRGILSRIEPVTVLLLLPVFFISTGVEANIRGITLSGLGELALILLVACVGKFVGASVGARLQGIPFRASATIATLMNTRGLTELVILNVGLAFGVLDTELFTLLVVMAIVTTVMTEPLLRIVYPDRLLARDVAEAERATVGSAGPYRILVALEDSAHGSRLVDLAVDLASGEQGAELVLTRFTPRVREAEIGSEIAAELQEMAASMDALGQMAERVKTRGVACSVLYQFSNDVASDLIAQATSLDASILLIGAPRESSPRGRLVLQRFSDRLGIEFDVFLRRLLDEAPCDLGVLVHPYGPSSASPQSPIVIVADGGPHEPAAVALAVRASRTRGAELRLVYADDGRSRNHRRVADLVEKIEELSVRCTALPTEARGAAAVVSGHSSDAGLVVNGVGDWRMGGQFGPAIDELVSSVTNPVLCVRGRVDEEQRTGSRLASLVPSARPGP